MGGIVVSAAAVVAVFQGCDDGTTSTDGSTASTASGTADSVSLSVTAYDRVKEIGEVANAGTGKVFLTVEVDIANGTTRSQILNLGLFSIRTTGGVEYLGAPEGDMLPGACDPNSSLAPGGMTHCAVAFKVPLETMTTQIVYTDGVTNTPYASDFTIDACNVCFDACIAAGAQCCDPDTNFQIDLQNCGSCGHVCAAPPTTVPNLPPERIHCEVGSCRVEGSTKTMQSCAAYCAGGGMKCVEGPSAYLCDSETGWPIACDDAGPPPSCVDKPFYDLYCTCVE
ncbi:MAG: DUF4352 domain-containing protein [Polyangiaceae bacterium]